MKNKKHLYFVGIKGVGMTPLAVIAKEAGFVVSGSDIEDNFITDSVLKKKGITPLIGFSKNHIKDIDLLITTGAHGGFDNPEVKEAKKRNIKVLTQGEAVGFFMDGEIFNRKFDGISIAGCHGKTTTTAMLATILKESGQDPSFLIGTSEIISLGQPGHFGKGKYFVAEADEYATELAFDKTPKFLWQNPKITIFTNIELDHPDLYDSIDEVRDAFLKFANKLSKNDVLIINGDDHECQKLIKEYKGKVVTFGISPLNDFAIKRISVSGLKTFFWLEGKNASFGEFSLNVSGEHNALNATAAIIASLECGLNINEIKKGLTMFMGTKRRSEFVGKLASGALLFDDYAHHPTEIKKTLRAFRQAFPKHKIVCVFQPHTFSRTKKLFEDFIYSFGDASTVVLTNIYPSLREKPDPSVSSELLLMRINVFNKSSIFLPELSDVVKYIDEKHFGNDTIVVTMGAGDIYKIKEKMEFQKEEV